MQDHLDKETPFTGWKSTLWWPTRNPNTIFRRSWGRSGNSVESFHWSCDIWCIGSVLHAFTEYNTSTSVELPADLNTAALLLTSAFVRWSFKKILGPDGIHGSVLKCLRIKSQIISIEHLNMVACVCPFLASFYMYDKRKSSATLVLCDEL